MHKKSNHKVRFTPYKDTEGIARVWVATVKDKLTGTKAKGVSICSLTDVPDDKEGKQRAYNKASRALERRDIYRIQTESAWDAIAELDEGEWYKFVRDELAVSAYVFK